MKYIATIVIVIVMLLSSVAISQYDLTHNYDPGVFGHDQLNKDEMENEL